MKWRDLAGDPTTLTGNASGNASVTSAGRSAVLVFKTGDQVMPQLHQWCEQQRITAAHFTAIGAFERVTVAWFDWDAKQYREIPIDEQVKVLSLAGDVACNGDKPAVHAHIVVGLRDATTRGGHFVDGTVRPTLELVLHETPAHLRKRHDPESGLALIDPSYYLLGCGTLQLIFGFTPA